MVTIVQNNWTHLGKLKIYSHEIIMDQKQYLYRVYPEVQTSNKPSGLIVETGHHPT